MRTSAKQLLSALFSAALVAVSSAASALPVTSWDYTVHSLFTQATFTDGTVSGSGSALFWGNGVRGFGTPSSSQSGLIISNDPASGTALTGNLTPSPANIFTHQNNAIQPPSLVSATIFDQLVLHPTGDLNPLHALTFSTNLHILFAETTNATPCVATSPANNPCNDIFVLDGASALNQTFAFNGDTYFLSTVDLTNALNPLNPLVCAAAGASSPCIGFTTIEGQDNAAQFGLIITAKPVTISVPVPGTVFLTGIALCALGFRLRNRN